MTLLNSYLWFRGGVKLGGNAACGIKPTGQWVQSYRPFHEAPRRSLSRGGFYRTPWAGKLLVSSFFGAEMPTVGANAPGATLAILEIQGRDGEATRVPLLRDRVVVGRLPESDVRINHPTVSRRHAEFFRDPFGRWWIRDLGARFGVRVSGRLVQEQVVASHEEVRLGEFVLRMSDAQGPENDSRHFERLETVTLVDAPHGHYSGLEESEEPRIAGSHLAALTEFGHRLIDIDSRTERLDALCQLLVSTPFRAEHAFALRLSKARPHEIPRRLASASALGTITPQHISRSLLTVFAKERAPVLASNAPIGPVDAELSVAFGPARVAATACLLNEDEEWLDVLYLLLPASHGTREWLTLSSLAATLFRQAEAAWSSRRRAEAHVRIERELEEAREIQRRLLPKAPAIEGLEIAIGFEPCRWVGGDYVDAAAMSDGRVLLTVADVCGKGLQAALVTGDLHAMVHSNLQNRVSPGQLMNSLNNYLCEYLPDMSFVTMHTLMMDPASGDCDYANAGHPLGILVNPGGALRTLAPIRNIPLGLQKGEYSQERARLDRGQWLVLYTDGLTDLANEEGAMLGPEGWESLLADCGRQVGVESALDFAAAVNLRLDAYRGDSVPQDDRTFLIVRRK